MKSLTYFLVILSLLWVDIAYRVATQPKPIIYRIPVGAAPANFVVPVQECARACRARARSARTQ